MERIRLSQLVYVLLLPVFFLLHNYNSLFGFIPLTYLLLFGLCSYLFAGFVFSIAFWRTRSALIASFITFCTLVLTFFFGAWHDFIKNITAQSFPSRYPFFLPVTILFFIVLIRYFIKKQQALKKFAGYLNLVVLILCCMELVFLFGHWQQYRKDHNEIYPQRPICNKYVPCSQPDSAQPDIYFIVFDEYTNNLSLQQLWHFDNGHITSWLSQKGFYMPDSSKANYSFTPYSISSILNMNYFATKKNGTLDELPAYFLKAVQSMSDNETFCILQKEHYNFHFISPFNNSFNTLDVDREFDRYAEKKLFNHTFPGRLMQDFGGRFQPSPEVTYKKKDRDNALIIDRIKSTANTSGNRRPQFVYGHLMITHKPHLYDVAGKVRTAADITANKPYFETYIDQVKQANKVMQELVDHILTHNKRNTLIIIMGDHGFRHLPDSQSYYFFPNFSAFYFPDKNYGPALHNISAVNTFRYIFNHYFCQNLPLLKDSSILVKY